MKKPKEKKALALTRDQLRIAESKYSDLLSEHRKQRDEYERKFHSLRAELSLAKVQLERRDEAFKKKFEEAMFMKQSQINVLKQMILGT